MFGVQVGHNQLDKEVIQQHRRDNTEREEWGQRAEGPKIQDIRKSVLYRQPN